MNVLLLINQSSHCSAANTCVLHLKLMVFHKNGYSDIPSTQSSNISPVPPTPISSTTIFYSLYTTSQPHSEEKNGTPYHPVPTLLNRTVTRVLWSPLTTNRCFYLPLLPYTTLGQQQTHPTPAAPSKGAPSCF